MLEELSKLTKEEIHTSLCDGPVSILDSDGKTYACLINPDQLALLQGVAEIAKDPTLYEKTISEHQVETETMTFDEAFPAH
jgi:hypothetical protein